MSFVKLLISEKCSEKPIGAFRSKQSLYRKYIKEQDISISEFSSRTYKEQDFPLVELKII